MKLLVPESDIQEVAIETPQVQQAAKQDLNFLAGLAIPEHFKYFFPAVFITVWLSDFHVVSEKLQS